ncbi:hypothetical protein LIER_42286 [Lithospermum erythrorhizon]|uniref:Uncharacterized protein n=1 Tax=Lithospermum erythrorhizon TaxID=34254 RepID=A0AAV3RNU6_LITER
MGSSNDKWPRETKRAAHRGVREEVEEDDDEDDVSDDENVKEVIISRKNKGIARREVHGYIGNTDAKENEFVHKREKKRVSYREEGSDNIFDNSLEDVDDDFVGMDETDEDEEFKPNEINELDEGEELPFDGDGFK